MGRPKSKDSKALNMKVDVNVFQLLEEYCEETGLSKTVAVERILKKFFVELEKKQTDKQ